jgi:hypothetical protein
MTPEDFSYFRSRVARFVSGSSSGIKFGSSVTPRYTRLSSILPKRALPQQTLAALQQRSASDDGGIEASSRGITALGKVALNIEQTKNNLEKIIQIIAEDYKTTQEVNRKESDELKKRIANRGRIFGKKELGDKKSDILGTVKKYVGSFFSGAGGAIRGLAMFNLLQGLLTGDPSKIIGPLLGIGLTYVPSIIGSVIGGVVGSIGTGLVGRMFGGGARAAAPAAAPAAGASRLGGLGRLGGRAALVGGGLALASSLFNRPQEDTQQQRLEQLTEQQKGLVAPSAIGPLPENELQRFDRLNKKFEEALDFLLKRQVQGGDSQKQGAGGAGSGISPSPVNMDTSARGTVGGQQFSNAQLVALAKKVGATDEEAVRLAAIAKYESGGRTGEHNDNYLRGGGDDSYGLWQINMIGRLGDARLGEFGLSNKEQLFDPVTNAQAALKVLRGSGWGAWTTNPKVTQSDLQEGRRSLGQSTSLPAADTTASQPTRPSSPSVARRRIPEVSSPVSSSPNVTVVPVPLNTSQQQTSDASIGNDVVPAIDTTYPENFLALYSKLIYQIV